VFELRDSHLQSRSLPLEPLLQSILLWLFWRWGLLEYLPRFASNLNPLNLSLPSSWHYKHESLVPGSHLGLVVIFFFIYDVR
jgi:hypothetical protein